MLSTDEIPISQMRKLKLREMESTQCHIGSNSGHVLHPGAFDVFILSFIAFILKTLCPFHKDRRSGGCWGGCGC